MRVVRARTGSRTAAELVVRAVCAFGMDILPAAFSCLQLCTLTQTLRGRAVFLAKVTSRR